MVAQGVTFNRQANRTRFVNTADISLTITHQYLFLAAMKPESFMTKLTQNFTALSKPLIGGSNLIRNSEDPVQYHMGTMYPGRRLP